MFERLKSKSSIRSQNLMLSCAMPHASDWLIAPPIHGLGLGLQSDVFSHGSRLGMPLFSEPYPCPALSREGKVCGDMMDVFGDHAPCCHHGLSLLFRHNNVRDILDRAGLAAVVTRLTARMQSPATSPCNSIIGALRPSLSCATNRLPSQRHTVNAFLLTDLKRLL